MTNATSVVQSAPDSASELSIALDVADVVSAITWPLFMAVILIVMRKQLSGLVGAIPSVFRQIKRISIWEFSLELATATAFTPKWTSTDNALDVRRSMSGVEINDSSVYHFKNQLNDPTPSDYAVVDLGEGHEWLSSRLYILSILLKRSKGIAAFVFVKSLGSRTRRLVGWAGPDTIRWALARRYPRLERAYASSYARLFVNRHDARIVSWEGMLGAVDGERSPELIIQVLAKFVKYVQKPAIPERERAEWEKITAQETTYEYANWLTADRIEEILGAELKREYVPSVDLDGCVGAERIERILQVNQRYVPVVNDEGSFQELIDRQVVLDHVASELS